MKRFILSTLFASALLGGCTPLFEGVADATLPSDKVRLVVQTDVHAFQKPEARAADESSLAGDLWVLVFSGSDDNATFEEAVKASVASGGERSVVLSRQSSAVRLLVLANAPEVIYQDGVALWPDNAFELTPLTSYAAAIEGIRTSELSAPMQLTNPYDQLRLPMSVSLSLAEISLSTTLGTVADPLRLKRVVAKIAARTEFSHSPSTFTLRGATVGAAPRSGTLFPTLLPTSSPSGWCDYQAPDPNPVVGIAPATAVRVDGVDYPEGVSTEGHPIYVYESTAAERPFVVVQGRYLNDVEDSYYKLLLPPSQVERNNYYRLRIRSVLSSGYTTLDEAKRAPASNLVRFDVEVIDLSSYDLIDNGRYFLGLSNSEWLSYGDNLSERSVVVAELGHNAPLGIATATATATAGVVLFSPFGDTNLFDGTPRHALALAATLPIGFESSVVLLRLGNLSRTVAISRHPSGAVAAEGARIDDFLGTTFIRGEVVDAATTSWIRFSHSPALSSSSLGLDRVESYDGGFYVHVLPNVGGRRVADLYLARSAGEGRLKVRIEQRGVAD